MTTTTDTPPDERLARLAARTATASRVPPARSAKVIAAGASTTAMLAMMAGMAIADRPPAVDAETSTAPASTEAAEAAPVTDTSPVTAAPVPVAVDVVVPVATPAPVVTALQPPAPVAPQARSEGS